DLGLACVRSRSDDRGGTALQNSRANDARTSRDPDRLALAGNRSNRSDLVASTAGEVAGDRAGEDLHERDAHCARPGDRTSEAQVPDDHQLVSGSDRARKPTFAGGVEIRQEIWNSIPR